jgi:hypothetical protein
MDRSGYYRLSSFYAAAQFFGWAHLLGSGLDQLRLSSRWKDRRLAGTLNLIDKAFNNLGYFRFAWLEGNELGDTGDVPKFVCPAIGELVAEGRSNPIGFAEFCARYREDRPFREWMDHLGHFFRKNDRVPLDPLNIRLRVVQLSLGAFINLLGPRTYFQRMSAARAGVILREIADPFVIDLVAVDLCRMGIPIYPEGTRRYWRRKLAVLLGRNPHLLPEPVEKLEGSIRSDHRQHDLSLGPDRARLYEWVSREAVERTLRFRKRATFSVQLEIDPRKVSERDRSRIAKNIEECSGRRILARHVRFIPLPSSEAVETSSA